MRKSAEPDVCTTQEAARLLGMSVSSVQQLVERGVLDAWKTQGGHRRIPVAAIEAFKAVAADPLAAAPAGDGIVKILVVDDNPMQRRVYETVMAGWRLPAQLSFCDNGYQALMQVAAEHHDILLADIVMEGMDGYELVKAVLANPQLVDTDIAILTSLSEEELAARGGIPQGTVYFAKPINFDELRGYVRACCARKLRAGAR